MIEFNKVGNKAAEKKVLNLKEYFDPMAGVSVFYVRPFTEELTQELEEQMRMMEKAGENRKYGGGAFDPKKRILSPVKGMLMKSLLK